MTSRQIVIDTLLFRNPPRVAMALPAPYPNDMCHGSRSVEGYRDPQLPPQGNEARRWKDEWGCTWATLTNFDKGEVVEGAIADWSQLDAYRPPDMGRPQDYRKAAAAFAASPEMFRIGHLPGFTFNIARYIRKMEHYLADLIIERENIDRLHAIVRGQLLKAIDCYADAGADAVMFGEDWGTQDRLMVSPAMWREIFRPEFEALCGRARERGLFVIMHSCGKMTDIIPDLIECGVHCLQFDQPRLHGIEFLARNFGGKVSFWCPVDIQRTLQTRDIGRIREDARLMVEQLGGQGGGFIAGRYPSDEAIGLGPEYQDAACQAFVEFAASGKRSPSPA
jgi:hypothetical protein